jgi:hypothetical protein
MKSTSIAAALAALLVPATAHAEKVCGAGRIQDQHLKMTVFADRQDDGPPGYSWIYAEASDPEAFFSVSTSYGLDGESALVPQVLTLTAYLALPSDPAADTQRISWRTDGGAWTVSHDLFASRITSDPANDRAYVSHTVGRTTGRPENPEIVGRLPQGVRFDLRRLDAEAREQSSGGVDYPAEDVVAELFERAKAAALADLKPCRPPVALMPSPRGR